MLVSQPSAGGLLIGYTLSLLERSCECAGTFDVVAASKQTQERRTVEFLDGLARAGEQITDLLSSAIQDAGLMQVAAINELMNSME